MHWELSPCFCVGELVAVGRPSQRKGTRTFHLRAPMVMLGCTLAVSWHMFITPPAGDPCPAGSATTDLRAEHAKPNLCRQRRQRPSRPDRARHRQQRLRGGSCWVHVDGWGWGAARTPASAPSTSARLALGDGLQGAQLPHHKQNSGKHGRANGAAGLAPCCWSRVWRAPAKCATPPSSLIARQLPSSAGQHCRRFQPATAGGRDREEHES